MFFNLRSHEIKPRVIATPWPLPRGPASSRGSSRGNNSTRQWQRINGFQGANLQEVTQSCLSFPTCRADGPCPSLESCTEVFYVLDVPRCEGRGSCFVPGALTSVISYPTIFGGIKVLENLLLLHSMTTAC